VRRVKTGTAIRGFVQQNSHAVYRKARRDAFGQSIDRLQQASSVAVSMLLKVPVDAATSASARGRAADLVLDSLELERAARTKNCIVMVWPPSDLLGWVYQHHNEAKHPHNRKSPGSRAAGQAFRLLRDEHAEPRNNGMLPQGQVRPRSKSRYVLQRQHS
jgi:hypothetical protein